MSAEPIASPETHVRRTWTLSTQYLVDSDGNRVSVLLPVDQWEKLMDDLEDLYDVRALDAAKAENPTGETIPWETLKAEFELDDDDECATA